MAKEFDFKELTGEISIKVLTLSDFVSGLSTTAREMAISADKLSSNLKDYADYLDEIETKFPEDALQSYSECLDWVEEFATSFKNFSQIQNRVEDLSAFVKKELRNL